jgi:lipoprotein-releasing system permease protein
LAQELLEYKSNQIPELIKETSKADEAAIIEKLQTIFNNKIKKTELNSMKPCINVEYRKHRCLFDFTLVIVVAFQPYWRTNHDS